MNKTWLLLFLFYFPFYYFCQIRSDTSVAVKNIYLNAKDSLNTNEILPAKNNFMIGFQAGLHTANLHKSGFDFDRNFYGEVMIRYNLSDEVHSVFGFTYWQAETREVYSEYYTRSAEIIISKGFKTGINFSLVEISDVSLSLGPFILIENIKRVVNLVFTYGSNIKLSIPFWNEKANLSSSFNFQNGGEVLNVGGGKHYLFFSYVLGMEFKL